MIPKKIRKERIQGKLKSIAELLDLIGENFPKELGDFLDSRILKDAIYKETESAIEFVIDICNIINSDLRLGTPATEEAIIKNLETNKILSKETIRIIEEMKGFRNVLVHKYDKIDDGKAYESIKEGLEDFEKIINEIEEFLKKN